MNSGDAPGLRRPPSKCLRCGGATIAGVIGTLEPLAFFVSPKGFLSTGASSPVEATCCQTCGEISIRATDPEKLSAAKVESDKR